MKSTFENIKISDERKEIKNPNTRDIGLWLDVYDDVFSDFDLREFNTRNISDDFIAEVKKLARESDFHVNEFMIHLPAKGRNAETEAVIKKRLHAFFSKNQAHYSKKKKFGRTKGILLTIPGLLMMVWASYVVSLQSTNFWINSIMVICEPTGWFLVWTGLETFIRTTRVESPELEFYNKLSKSKITFHST